MRTEHDILCPKPKDASLHPQSCVFCELIDAVKQNERDDYEFEMRARGWR